MLIAAILCLFGSVVFTFGILNTKFAFVSFVILFQCYCCSFIRYEFRIFNVILNIATIYSKAKLEKFLIQTVS